jgi:hypothetical protein
VHFIALNCYESFNSYSITFSMCLYNMNYFIWLKNRLSKTYTQTKPKHNHVSSSHQTTDDTNINHRQDQNKIYYNTVNSVFKVSWRSSGFEH